VFWDCVGSWGMGVGEVDVTRLVLDTVREGSGDGLSRRPLVELGVGRHG
jgi:hypothetical protein